MSDYPNDPSIPPPPPGSPPPPSPGVPPPPPGAPGSPYPGGPVPGAPTPGPSPYAQPNVQPNAPYPPAGAPFQPGPPASPYGAGTGFPLQNQVQGGRSGLALSSMIIGIVGIFLCFFAVLPLVALILGIVSLRQIGKSNGAQSGKGFAIAGIVLGAVGTVLGALTIISVAAGDGFNFTSNDTSPDVGECVEVPSDGGLITSIKRQKCDEAHEGEVIGAGKLTGLSDEYDSAAASALAEERCIAAFGDYTGVEYLESELSIFYIIPDENAWDDDDRSYVCIAYNESGDLPAGSVEG